MERASVRSIGGSGKYQSEYGKNITSSRSRNYILFIPVLACKAMLVLIGVFAVLIACSFVARRQTGFTRKSKYLRSCQTAVEAEKRFKAYTHRSDDIVPRRASVQ